jgi:hypothetical protein
MVLLSEKSGPEALFFDVELTSRPQGSGIDACE